MLADVPVGISLSGGLDSSIVAMLASQDTTVQLNSFAVGVEGSEDILTGEGADEIYAGYDYLRSFESHDELQREMTDITISLHNTNLQRADRIAMALGLEARVPFLDIKSVDLGLGLPAKWKIHGDKPAEYLLRQAFRADLPEEIVNRPKEKFSKGAGSANIIAEVAVREISDAEFQAGQARLLKDWNYRLLNKEALYYYRSCVSTLRMSGFCLQWD